ncbi:MAG: OsmC family protein [Gammaproteobacteria bacterium]|nr:OsmC family protein [Gammaproteobacteria bacterium]
MKTRIKWVEDVTFMGESGSGHTVIMDGPPEEGGRNLGARPMEMLLLGMGGCTAFDVITILKKSRQSVTDCTVEIEAQRSDKPPKIFTRIHVHYLISGRSIKDSHVKRAVTLSTEKYCSASIMLGKTAEITHDYTIEET